MIKVLRALLYCTKGKMKLRKSIKDKDYYLDNGSEFNIIPKEDYSLNGKMAIECDFEVEKIKLIETPEYAGSECNTFLYDVSLNFETETLTEDELCKQSCLKASELNKYLDLFKEREIYGYAVHIKNLYVFDEPKELKEYHKIIETTYGDEPDANITKTPKNMMRCCYEKKARQWNYGIIIPVSPEEMCRIANKQQDILIRKRVLKEILNND